MTTLANKAIIYFKSLPGGASLIYQTRKLWFHLCRNALVKAVDNVLISWKYKKAKQRFNQQSRQHLRQFLSNPSKISFPAREHYDVDVIIVLYNQAPLTLACLESLQKSQGADIHPIIFDNASQDETRQLLEHMSGATIIEHPENIGFLQAVNLAAAMTRSEHILLLNNDTIVPPQAISQAIQTMNSSDDIGAVGAKLILLNGRIQEAGSIVWQDGSCFGYGRGQRPEYGEFCFQRDVDYCSGAFLLIRRNLFEKLHGFDGDYAPAYYEETDFCTRLIEQDYRIVYDPKIEIRHFEFGSSKKSKDALRLQKRNRAIYREKHTAFLKERPPASKNYRLQARSRKNSEGNILIIDDQAPHQHLGGGFPRARQIINILHELDLFITLYPLRQKDAHWEEIYQSLPAGIEVVWQNGPGGLQTFLTDRQNYYSFIMVSRLHNMKVLNRVHAAKPELFEKSTIIYDAEAIFALRKAAQLRLAGKKLSPPALQKMLADELSAAKNADHILAVSQREANYYLEAGHRQVHVLGHSIEAFPGENSFEQRKNFLFVGSLDDDESPNTDSLVWFAQAIWPLVQNKLGNSHKLMVVGSHKSKIARSLASDSIILLGQVADLTDIYNQTRVFIAPTRFAAGIPHKIHEAAAHGLPVVATPLLAKQLGWQHDKQLLTGDSASEFAEQCAELYNDRTHWIKIRNQALKKAEDDCSPEKFQTLLKKVLFDKR